MEHKAAEFIADLTSTAEFHPESTCSAAGAEPTVNGVSKLFDDIAGAGKSAPANTPGQDCPCEHRRLHQARVPPRRAPGRARRESTRPTRSRTRPSTTLTRWRAPPIPWRTSSRRSPMPVTTQVRRLTEINVENCLKKAGEDIEHDLDAFEKTAVMELTVDGRREGRSRKPHGRSSSRIEKALRAASSDKAPDACWNASMLNRAVERSSARADRSLPTRTKCTPHRRRSPDALDKTLSGRTSSLTQSVHQRSADFGLGPDTVTVRRR